MSIRISLNPKNIQETKKMIREFTQSDKDDLMSIENQFTVSYEIELESKENMFSSGLEPGDPDEERDKDRRRAEQEYTQLIKDELLSDIWVDFEEATDGGPHTGPLNIQNNLITYAYENGYFKVNYVGNLEFGPSTFISKVGIFIIGCESTRDLGAAFANRFKEQMKTFGGSALLKIYNNYPNLKEKIVSCVNSKIDVFTYNGIKKIVDSLKIEEFKVGEYFLEDKIPDDILGLDSNTKIQITQSAFNEFVRRYYIDFNVDKMFKFGYSAEDVDFAQPSFFNICSELRLESDYNTLLERGVAFLNILADGNEGVGEVIDQLNSRWRLNIASGYTGGITTRFINSALDNINGSIDSHVEMHMDVWDDENPIDDYYERFGYGSGDYDRDEDELADVYSQQVSKYLPNFYNRFGNELKFEADGSLDTEQGLEFSCETYLDGLKEAMEFLDLFFEDYDNQDFFFFSKKTGMHMNIGHKSVGGNPKNDFNLIKGFLFLSEDVADSAKQGDKKKVARARKGLPDTRAVSRWAGSIAPTINNEVPQQAKARIISDYIKKTFNVSQKVSNFYSKEKGIDSALIAREFMASFETGEDSMIEKLFSDSLEGKAADMGPKNIGFNINYARGKGGNSYVKYIEFRYPGHEMTLETSKDLTLYYAYIVRHMVDKSYMKEEYIKKLVGLLNRTVQVVQTGYDKTFEIMKVGNPIVVNYHRPSDNISEIMSFVFNMRSNPRLLLMKEPIQDVPFYDIMDPNKISRINIDSHKLSPVSPIAIGYIMSQGKGIKNWPISAALALPAIFNTFGYGGIPAIITSVSGEGMTASIGIELFSIELDPQIPKEYVGQGYLIATPEYSPIKVVSLKGTITGAELYELTTQKHQYDIMYGKSVKKNNPNHYLAVSRILKQVKQFVDSNGGEVPIVPKDEDIIQ